MRNNVDINAMKERVLNLIPKSQASAITGKELCSLTGLPLRTLKEIITELRSGYPGYPICAKETDGGGYWIAENKQDITEFIEMIKRRRDGYNNTIMMMTDFLNEVL